MKFVPIVGLMAVVACCSGCCWAAETFGGSGDCTPTTFGSNESEGPCGPPPSNAAPGEVWCCVPVEVFGTAPQRICVKEESVRRVDIPAVYDTVTESVMVSPGTPGRVEWRRVECQTGADNSECWQLVEIPPTPPVYETRTKQVLRSPATYTLEHVPAEYEEVPGAPAYEWRWRRFSECEIPANAAAVHFPPAIDR